MNRSIEIADFIAVQIEKLSQQNMDCWAERKRLKERIVSEEERLYLLRRLYEENGHRMDGIRWTLRYFRELSDPLSSSSSSSTSDESQPPPAAPPNTQEDE